MICHACRDPHKPADCLHGRDCTCQCRPRDDTYVSREESLERLAPVHANDVLVTPEIVANLVRWYDKTQEN